MRKAIWAALLGAMFWACGGGGGLPGGTPANDGGGGAVIPPVTDPPASATSLWPLTQGSTWTYRITDPLVAVPFEKKVEVLGVMDVPGTNGAKAVAVRSTQAYIGREELSWQLVIDGVVLRVREEDWKDGQLVRVTTWDPLTMKSIDAAEATGWTRTETVNESITDGSGNVIDTKQKDFAWTVSATQVAVTTPKGSFDNSVKLQRLRPDKTGWERTYWLVAGIGKVREEGERTEELIDYDVKP